MATYRRHDILATCLRLAGRQTRPPSEVVVVDASPDFDLARARIVADFEREFPHIPLRYERATRASSSVQRNEAVRYSTRDVVFLIDDDSLMYPDCAEQIMAVYESDPTGAIVGVSAMIVDAPPPEAQGPAVDPSSFVAGPKQTRLRKMAKRILRTDESWFVPYDEDFPAPPLPPELERDGIGRIRMMTGCAMTMRRSIFEREQFTLLLERYAAGEDQDLSYRASRHGALVNATRAYLCHAQSPGGRVSKFAAAALANLNPIVLHRFHSNDKKRSGRRLARQLAHRALISLLKELKDGDLPLPRTRGIAYAALWFPVLWNADLEQLGDRYREVQKRLLE